jgi:hypothetical protein
VSVANFDADYNHQYKKIDSVNYFWKVDKQTQKPSAIFNFNANICSDQQKMWPLSGVTVKNTTFVHNYENVVLVIIGTIVCSATISKEESLTFEEKATFFLVVINPYDNPDAWIYHYQIIPLLSNFDGVVYKW